MPRNQTYSVASAPAVTGSGLSCRDSDYFLDSVHRFRIFFGQCAQIQIIFLTGCIDSDYFLDRMHRFRYFWDSVHRFRYFWDSVHRFRLSLGQCADS